MQMVRFHDGRISSRNFPHHSRSRTLIRHSMRVRAVSSLEMQHCKSKANVLKIRPFSEYISKVYDTCKNVGQRLFYDMQLKATGVLYETDEQNIDAKRTMPTSTNTEIRLVNMKDGRYHRLSYGG